MVFSGTSSSDQPSVGATPNCTLVFASGSFVGRKVGLSGLLLLAGEALVSVVRVNRDPSWLLSRDVIITASGRRVGMQAEMIPLEDSMRHQVQASPSVQVVSVGWNLKRVVNRNILVNTTLHAGSPTTVSMGQSPSPGYKRTDKLPNRKSPITDRRYAGEACKPQTTGTGRDRIAMSVKILGTALPINEPFRLIQVPGRFGCQAFAIGLH
ncbi:hypothetical protein MAP00_002951 [Monascus purpureus]|nr:hypothetical protein MAP00_002951 [Monascus purpureus]